MPVFRHFSYSRDFDVLPVLSKHLKGRSAPRVSDVFAHAKDFVVFLFPGTFRIQGILSFPCFWTFSVFKGFCRFPVSRHFLYSRDFVVSLFQDTLNFLETEKTIKSFEKIIISKRFCHFSCLETLSGFKSV